jgi:hypothetical protein
MTRLEVKNDLSAQKLSPTLRQNRAKGWGNPKLVFWKGWATLYNRVGVVKRHLDRLKVLCFPFVEILVLLLVFCSSDQSSLFRITRWNLVPPTIYPVTRLPTMIRCFRLPDCSGRQDAQSAQR